jgi:hypothetical protein
VAATTTITSTSLGARGNQWNPSVDIEVTGPDGSVLPGAVIELTWTLQPSGQTVVQTCTVLSTGVCSFQLNRLENRSGNLNLVDEVTATVTSVTGTNPTITYTPGGTTVTLNAPNA